MLHDRNHHWLQEVLATFRSAQRARRGFVGVRDSTTNRYLVVLSSHGSWTLPGGDAETNETGESAARRKLAEESGYLIPGQFDQMTSTLFTTQFDFSTVNRHNVFSSRTAPHETQDFGFVRLSDNHGSMEVQRFQGNVHGIQSFRGSTVRLLHILFNTTAWYESIANSIPQHRDAFQQNPLRNMLMYLIAQIHEREQCFHSSLQSTGFYQTNHTHVQRWVQGFHFITDHTERYNIIKKLEQAACRLNQYTSQHMLMYRAERGMYGQHRDQDMHQPDRDAIALSVVKDCAVMFQQDVQCYSVSSDVPIFPVLFFNPYECEVLLFQVHIIYRAGTEQQPHQIVPYNESRRFT